MKGEITMKLEKTTKNTVVYKLFCYYTWQYEAPSIFGQCHELDGRIIYVYTRGLRL